MDKIAMLFVILFLSACDFRESYVENGIGDGYFAKRMQFARSPNGNRLLELGERGNDSTGWVTQAYITFGTDCGGEICSAPGKDKNMKANWRGNDTVIIECRKNERFYMKHDFVQCFTKKVRIVYIEK